MALGGQDRVKVQIPQISEEYQNFLNSLKEMERQREENGGLTQEGIEGVRKATKGVDRLAQKTYQKQRGN